MKTTHNSAELSADLAAQSTLPDFLSPDVTLAIATWACFFALLYVLKKFAWAPILDALDSREQRIRQSVDDAERIKKEMSELAETQRVMIQQSEEQSREIIEDGRRAAKEAAKHITDQAREEAQIILKNAERDIREQVKEAQAELREVSASVAVRLASQIIEKHLDEAESKRLISKYIDEL